MPRPALDDAQDLLTFLDASPSPYHAVATVADHLDAAGFVALDAREPWPSPVDRRSGGSAPAGPGGRAVRSAFGPGPVGGYVRRGGSLVAWLDADADAVARGYRIIGAHTDSPNLRIKPAPDTGRAGYRQLGVEVYGGALLNSWLDRDLGLSGRVAVRSTGAGAMTTPDERLVRVDEAILRIPQLAIHLDRGVNESGLKLNAQQHLVPVWGLGPVHEGDFAAFLAEQLGVGRVDVLGWDVMVHDRSPAALLGRDRQLVSSGRLDNLLSCWAATGALLDARERAGTGAARDTGVPVICLFDHEEIGSQSATGAAGALLPALLERVSAAAGVDRTGHLAALAASRCVSADGAHATHPNYAERHDPDHGIALDGGPVIKHNANVRYATDAGSAGWFSLVCEQASVPVQHFVMRSDMPCGSTIGPITSAGLGIDTVDVGVAQLSMHSARELCGAGDPHLFRRALAQFLAPR
jgi:aspartyl aminopeptidase